MSVLELYNRLQSLGVELFIEGEGLGFDAPPEVLSDDLIEEMRAQRDELIAFVDVAGLLGMDPIPGVVCPVCRGDRFIDEPSGWRCKKCNRLAWGWLGGSFVRADFVLVEL